MPAKNTRIEKVMGETNIEKDNVNMLMTDQQYRIWVNDLSRRYKQSQVQAAIGINGEQLRFYWTVGRDIVAMHIEERWGHGILKQLSNDLSKQLDRKGFSVTSLGYMKRFYLLYPDAIPILPSSGGEMEKSDSLPPTGGKTNSPLFCISWSLHKAIIDAVGSDSQKGFFFVRKTLQNQWGRGMLLNMLGTDLYEVQGKAATKFNITMPTQDADLAQDLVKGVYDFSFAQIDEHYNEAQLKERLVGDICQFLLELGRGFSFVGKEYRICAAGKEKYIDLLFYIIPLHRYCVIEVKTTEFDFPDVGQLAGYMGMVDEVLNVVGDNDCIGLLICHSKNNIFAHYALSKINAPIGVAEYKLGKSTLPQDFQDKLPTEEEISKGLTELKR